MTPARALKIASRRVSIDRFGNQHQVSHWSPEHDAWWNHNPQDWRAASRNAREYKIRIALELLGMPADEAYFTGEYEGAERGDWRRVVRDAYRKWKEKPT